MILLFANETLLWFCQTKIDCSWSFLVLNNWRFLTFRYLFFIKAVQLQRFITDFCIFKLIFTSCLLLNILHFDDNIKYNVTNVTYTPFATFIKTANNNLRRNLWGTNPAKREVTPYRVVNMYCSLCLDSRCSDMKPHNYECKVPQR